MGKTGGQHVVHDLCGRGTNIAQMWPTRVSGCRKGEQTMRSIGWHGQVRREGGGGFEFWRAPQKVAGKFFGKKKFSNRNFTMKKFLENFWIRKLKEKKFSNFFSNFYDELITLIVNSQIKKKKFLSLQKQPSELYQSKRWMGHSISLSKCGIWYALVND